MDSDRFFGIDIAGNALAYGRDVGIFDKDRKSTRPELQSRPHISYAVFCLKKKKTKKKKQKNIPVHQFPPVPIQKLSIRCVV